MAKPGNTYVGITGLKTKEEVDSFVRMAKNPGLPDWVMLGFTCSNKRLADHNSSGKTSPSFNSLVNELLPPLNTAAASARYLPMVHYFTSDLTKLAKEVKEIFEPLYHQGLCRAIQINAEWPDIAQLMEIKDAFPKLVIVLQLPRSATEKKNGYVIADRAKAYNNHISYMLIDPSGGEGADVDLDTGAMLIDMLSCAMPSVRVGIAGGFSAENVGRRVHYLGDRTKRDYCIDAQGKLRTAGKLDLAKCMMYLANAKNAKQINRVYQELTSTVDSVRYSHYGRS